MALTDKYNHIRIESVDIHYQQYLVLSDSQRSTSIINGTSSCRTHSDRHPLSIVPCPIRLAAIDIHYQQYLSLSYQPCCDIGFNVCLNLQNCHSSIFVTKKYSSSLNLSVIPFTLKELCPLKYAKLQKIAKLMINSVSFDNNHYKYQ